MDEHGICAASDQGYKSLYTKVDNPENTFCLVEELPPHLSNAVKFKPALVQVAWNLEFFKRYRNSM